MKVGLRACLLLLDAVVVLGLVVALLVMMVVAVDSDGFGGCEVMVVVGDIVDSMSQVWFVCKSTTVQ